MDETNVLRFLDRYAHVYLNEAKTSEARNTVAAITRAIAAYTEREAGVKGRPRRFPPSAPRTPPIVPRASKFLPDEETWGHPTWRALYFSMSQPMYFSYEIESSPDGRVATVRAYGDLDGKGKVTILERRMTIDENGEIVVAPELIVKEVAS